MELELGLKVTRTREDVSSSVDFRFSKDPFGPLVLSRETDSRFIIIIHLKGFKKEGIEIEINKEGDRVTIRGRKPVEEMVMIRWMAWRKEVEMREFRKVFLIPDVVDLDKIKARFDDDDATLTITMPKRVKGICGFNLEQEEEEEEEEESVDFGDVSEVENREEVEEENEEREESDEQCETQGEEGFDEMVEDKERESQVFGGEEDAKIEDDDLEKMQQVDEQDKVLGFAEEKTVVGHQKLADSDTESKDSGLKKLPGEDNQEVSGDIGSEETEETEEQESNEDSGIKKLPDTMDQEVVEQKVSEETRSEGIGSGAVETIEEQESDEVVGTSKSRATENKKTDGDDDGLRKAQGLEEPERRNEVSNIQETVEEETSTDHEKRKKLKMEIKGRDPKEDVDAEMGEGFTPEDNTAETEEHDSIKPEADKVDKKQEVVEKKAEEEDNTEVRRESGDRRRLTKFQENEETRSKGPKRRDREDNIMKEKAPEAETSIKNDVVKQVQETEASEVGSVVKTDDEGKEKKKSVEMETAPNIAETETKPEDIESEKVEEDEVEKIHKPAEKKEEEKDANVRAKGEDRRSLIKLPEGEEPHSKGRKRQDKQSNIKEFLEEKAPEAETNIVNDVPTTVHKEIEPEVGTLGEVVEQKVTEETKSGSGAVEEIEEKESKKTDGDGAALRKAHGTEEPARQNEERKKAKEESNGEKTRTEDDGLGKSLESAEGKNVGQKEFADSVTESGGSSSLREPPDMMDQKDSQAEARSDGFGSRALEEIEKQEPHDGTSKSGAKADDDDGLSKVQGSEESERHNEVRKIQEMVDGDLIEDVNVKRGEGFTPNNERTSVAAEDDIAEIEELESTKPEADKVEKKHELIEKKEEEEEYTKGRRESEERRSLIKVQENEEQHSKGRKREDKHENAKEMVKEKEKAPVAETSIENDVVKQVQETEASEVGEGKEKKKSVRMETAPNIAETETKPEDFESETQGAEEVEEMHELAEKKEVEDASVRRKSEDISLIKLQENEEQLSKGRKGQEKQENIKELLEEKAPEADVSKPVQEIEVPNTAVAETKPEEYESEKLEADEVDKIHKLVEKKENEDEDEKNAEVGTKSEDNSSLKPQEFGEQQSQGQKTQENIKELVEEKTPEAETRIENDTPKPVQEETNDAESRTPQETIRFEKEVLGGGEEEMVQELAEEKTHFSKNGKVNEDEEKVTEKKTELDDDDDDISRKSGDLDAKEEVDAEMSKESAPETETKPEDIESEKVEEEEVNKTHKMVEKKEEEFADARRKGEDISLVKLQEKQEHIKQSVEEKAPEAETNIAPEEETLDAKEELEVKFGVPNTAETETKPDEFVSDQLKADELHELVEKEDENSAKARTESEDVSLLKPQEVGEQQSQGQKQHHKQKKIEELVEDKTPEADRNVKDDATSKPVQERCEEGKQKIPKLIQEEPKKQHKEKVVETGKKINDDGSREAQEIIRQQELDEAERWEKESKTNDEEKGIEQTVTKDQESYRPKILWDEETAEKKTEFDDNDHQISRGVGDTEGRDSYTKEEVDAEMEKGFKPNLPETETKGEEFESDKLEPDENDDTNEVVEEKNAKVRRQSEDRQENEKQHSKRQRRQEKTAETETSFPTPVGDSDVKEKFDPEISKGSTPKIPETEKKADTVKAVEEERTHELVEKKKKKEENDKVRRQSEDTANFKGLQEEKPQGPNGQNKQGNIKELVEEKPVQETERPEVDTCEEKVFAETETKDQESYRPKLLGGEDKIQELAEEKMNISRKVEEEEETAENNTEVSDDDAMSRKAPEIEQRGSDAMRGKESVQEEKVSDGGKKIVGEGKAENDKSRTVQEIDEHEKEEEDQVQKTIGEETSSQGEVQDVESEKKTTEADKRFREAKEDTFLEDGTTSQNEQEEADRPERGKGRRIEQELVNLNSQMEQQNGEKSQELVDGNINNCKEEESAETKANDVIGNVEGIKEHELPEPEKDHVSKIEDLMKDKTAEPEIEAEHGDLNKGSEEHEPTIHRERYKTKITGTEEPSGQDQEEEEKVETMRITEKEKSPNALDNKRESHEKQRYQTQDLVEAGHKDDKLVVKVKQETEEDTSKKVQETEQQGSDGLRSPVVQDKKQETEEKEEDKIHEPVGMGTSDYKEKTKNDISRIQEPEKPNLDELERHGEQAKIPQGEDMIQEPAVELRTHDYNEKVKKQDGDDSSDKFHEIEERKVNEDWTHEMQEKRKDCCKEEETDPKKSQEQEKTRAVEEEEEKEIVEMRAKTEDVSLRKVQDDAEPELSEPYKRQEEEKVDEAVGTRTSDYREEVKKQDGDDTLRSKGPNDKEDHYDRKEEKHEEKVIAKTELKSEIDTSEKAQEIEKQKSDELQRSLVQDKMQETEEKVRDEKEPEAKRLDEDKIKKLEETETRDYREKVKTRDGDDDVVRNQQTVEMDLVEEEATGLKDKHTEGKGEPEEEKRYEKVAQTETKVEDETNKELEENKKEAVDSLADTVTKTQETEKEESHDSENHEKLDIVQDFVEEETKDQEDRSRILQRIKEDEEELKEQRHDPGVEKEEDEEKIAEREAHVQELEGNTEKFKDYDGESRRGGKTFETKRDYGVIVRKVRETKVQESNEKKDPEQEEKIEELERKQTSNHGVKLLTEEDNGQDFIKKESSKRQPVGQEHIQQLKVVEKQEDEEKSEAGVELQAKVKEEKGIEGSEKAAEVEMQAKIGIRMKDQEAKRQEPYELLENEEHDKIPEPTVEGTQHEREEDREVEKIKRKSDDVSSREVQKIKEEEETDDLEKHRKLSEIQENQPVNEEEVNEAGGYKAVLKKAKSVENSSQSKDAAEKRSDQNEKAQRITHVESKANDDSSEKDETKRLRGKKQKEVHQQMGTSDQRKEEREEKIVGKAVTRDECDSSSKNQDHEEEQSDKLEEMSGSLAKEETSNDKEENRGNRAAAETTIKDDGFSEEQLAIVLRHREQDKKQLVVDKDTSGKAKDKRNQETKSGGELVQQRSTDNLQVEETKIKNKESSKTHQLIETGTGEVKRRKDKELEEDTTHSCRETECEADISKKTQEIDKEGSTEPRRDVERDKIPPVDSETSEDDSEELEVEVEDSEEDWEAEVIQEMDSDDDNDKLRRIKLGFRLIGGSTLFMSLIVMVFRLIRSKRKIKCYKF